MVVRLMLNYKGLDMKACANLLMMSICSKKKHITKLQIGFCGLTHCYVDARTGALLEKKIEKTI